MKMNKTIQYKNYHGSVEVSIEDNLVYGKILFIDDLVTYQSDKLNGILDAFKEAVDDYIETCNSIDREPQKSFSGSFNVRIGHVLHRKAVIAAHECGMTLNELIKDAISKYLDVGSTHTATYLHIPEKAEKQAFYFEKEEHDTWSKNITENEWKRTPLLKH